MKIRENKTWAVKTTTTQTKSTYADYKPAEAGFVCIAPILIAGQK